MESNVNVIDYLDIIAIIASIVSMIIGFFAIWLAIKFYKFSVTSAEDIKQASNNIDSTVTRLEALFEKLYSGTFSMMKDTVSDMRKFIYQRPDKEDDKIEESAKNQFEELKKGLSNELKLTLEKMAGTELKIGELNDKIENIADKFIDASLEVDKNLELESIRKKIITLIDANRLIEKPISFKYIRDSLKNIISEEVLADIIFEMRNDNVITWEGDQKTLGINDIISFSDKKK